MRLTSPSPLEPAPVRSPVLAAPLVQPQQLEVIGFLERVALPRWGIGGLTAKMDTGADTSALHVEELRLLGATRVGFVVLGEGPGGPVRCPVEARVTRKGWVRSSNGEEEERLFVRTSLRLAGRSRPVEFGLVDRSRMQQRLLLGRSALEGRFLIDPARCHLVGAVSTAPDAGEPER